MATKKVKDDELFEGQAESLNKLEETAKTLEAVRRHYATAGVKFENTTKVVLLGFSLVERLFSAFMNHKEFNKATLDIKAAVNLDYKISYYAGFFYTHAKDQFNIGAEFKTKTDKERFEKYRVLLFTCAKKLLAIAARWDLEKMIEYYEFEMKPSSRPYEKRRPLLTVAAFYLNRMNAVKMGVDFRDNIKPKRLIFAVEPNGGKSFLGNYYSVVSSVLHWIYYKTSGVLRISNEKDNATGFNVQIRGIHENEKIKEIYPELEKYFVGGKCKIFEKEAIEELKYADLNPRIRASFFALSIYGSFPSKRAFVAIITDDISNGVKEMNNDEIHLEQATIVKADVLARKESEDIPEIYLGTFYNENCIQIQIIDELENAGELFQHYRYPYVRYTKDYNTVVITIDCFDKNGNSIAPSLISTKTLVNIQNGLKPYEFDLIYRQKKASRTPRIFSYDNLKLYDKLPDADDFESGATATIDPTRKSGNDWFSMPVFKYNTKDNLFYLVDAIFEQSSLGINSDPNNKFLAKIVDFIIKNEISRLIIENNTSNTIGTLLRDNLAERGYKNIKIEERYSTKSRGKESKIQRILSQEATICANICFPSPNTPKRMSALYNFMYYFTRFDCKENIGKPSNPDDAPDSVAMFSDNCIFSNKGRLSSITPLKKESLWR